MILTLFCSHFPIQSCSTAWDTASINFSRLPCHLLTWRSWFSFFTCSLSTLPSLIPFLTMREEEHRSPTQNSPQLCITLNRSKSSALMIPSLPIAMDNSNLSKHPTICRTSSQQCLKSWLLQCRPKVAKVRADPTLLIVFLARHPQDQALDCQREEAREQRLPSIPSLSASPLPQSRNSLFPHPPHYMLQTSHPTARRTLCQNHLPALLPARLSSPLAFPLAVSVLVERVAPLHRLA